MKFYNREKEFEHLSPIKDRSATDTQMSLSLFCVQFRMI